MSFKHNSTAHGSQAYKCLPQNSETEDKHESQEGNNVPKTNQYITPLSSIVQQNPQDFMSNNDLRTEKIGYNRPRPLFDYSWRPHISQRSQPPPLIPQRPPPPPSFPPKTPSPSLFPSKTSPPHPPRSYNSQEYRNQFNTRNVMEERSTSRKETISAVKH